MKTAVSATSVGLSMRAELLQWTYMGLERRSMHKTDHELILIVWPGGRRARVQAACEATQIMVLSTQKSGEKWEF